MVKTLKKIAALAGAVVLSATMLSGCAKEKAAELAPDIKDTETNKQKIKKFKK